MFNASALLPNRPSTLLSASELYANAGTDFTTLSWAEQQWAAFYIWVGDPVIATGLATFVLHETVYFGRALPWIIIDAIPYFRRWKLQPAKVPTAADQWACTKLVLFSHFTVELPLIWLFHPIAELCGMRTWQVPFSDWKSFALQLVVFFMFEDAFHYFAHQALHWGPLYRNIHKIHHKYSAPFGLAAEYAHPIEVLILGTGTIGGPLLYVTIFSRLFPAGSPYAWIGDLHMFTVHLWITLRLFQAIDSHSGYDFPWSLHNWFPLWSGAEHHDFHHMAFTNNYSTSFRYLDFILGTDDKYRAYRKRVAAASKVSGEERKRMEKQLMEQAEREGIEAEKVAESVGWSGRPAKTIKVQ